VSAAVPDSGARWRLFFAALPDDAAGEALAARAVALELDAGARLVLRHNLHMTLAFLGDVPVSQLPLVRRIGDLHSGAAFSLRFDAYEYWPKPEVVVVAARTVPPTLQELWQRLHHDLKAAGWALDAKRLRPHVTLARKVSQSPVLPAMSGFVWPVRNLSLMRSTTSGVHSVYTVVDTWSLLDNGDGA
jgi:2'-5' RNA ligase